MLFKKKPKPEKSDGDAGGGGGDADSPGAEMDAGTENASQEAPRPRFSRKMMIVAAAAAVVVLGGGTGAFLLLKPGVGAEAGHKPAKKGGHGGSTKGGRVDPALGEVKAGPDGVTFYTLPDLVVNIQAADGRPTFLKLKLTFEVEDPAVAERMMADAPRLKDMFQTFLRELRPEDLAGSQGSYQLRLELLRRVNLIVAPDQVEAVLIEEMLIQ